MQSAWGHHAKHSLAADTRRGFAQDGDALTGLPSPAGIPAWRPSSDRRPQRHVSPGQKVPTVLRNAWIHPWTQRCLALSMRPQGANRPIL